MSATGGTVAASVVDGIVEAAAAHGARPEALRGALREALGTPSADGRYPIARLYALWERALAATQLPALPIRVGRAARFDRYGVLGYALYVSRTAEHAVRRLCRYGDVLTDSGQWSLRGEGPNVVVAWARPGTGALGERVANEQVLAAFVTVAEQVVAASLPIVEVRHRHAAPAAIAEHERHYRARVRFGAPEDAVVIPAAYLGRTPIGADPHLDAYFAEQITGALALARRADAVEAVARIVLALLPDGVPGMREVARRLDISERTLRRRLADHGRTFAELVDGLQRERARQLLAGPAPIGEVALAVGFHEPSAFTRAVRRWTGRTPSELRRASASGSEVPPRDVKS